MQKQISLNQSKKVRIEELLANYLWLRDGVDLIPGYFFHLERFVLLEHVPHVVVDHREPLEARRDALLPDPRADTDPHDHEYDG